MKLSIIKKTSKNSNLIILSEKNASLKEWKFSEDELKFIKKSIKNNDKIIEINQYSRYVFLIFAETSKTDENKENFRSLAYKVFSLIRKKQIEDVCVSNDVFDFCLYNAFIEGLMLSNYTFLKYFTKDIENKKEVLKTIQIREKKATEQNTKSLQTIIEGVFVTRDLVNEPFSGLNSVDLSNRIKKLSTIAGFTAEVLNKKQIEALKMGGLLAVNRASKIPPTFSILEWKPEDAKNKKPLILVGKGIVFDTGGYNLKPGKYMDNMKSDMAGAAAVVGTLYAIAKLKLPVHVIGLVPATDNLIGKDGYVTGDVIKMHNGMTVEVLNTDAEGRLILADALSYAQKYSPELVIDIATLTGAAVGAIGTFATAMMAKTNKNITKKLYKSADYTHERLIEFPLWEEYGEGLKSKIADIKNIGGAYAGHISAAKFLEHFTDYPWVHLDIAPSAFLETKTDYRGVGATGTPVRLLVNFIQNYI
ncbi:MAG: leucyl aminopeptidase family protein [Bacteroidales bacterium]|nr:leucyl aminopeptidase family protein [Bacteroidales bacterium]